MSEADHGRYAPESIRDALRNLTRDLTDITAYSAHDELDALSSNTILTGIDADEDTIIRRDDHWIAPVTLYVELNYGSRGDKVVLGDAFPGEIEFEVEDGEAQVRDVRVDTHSFYGPEAENA